MLAAFTGYDWLIVVAYIIIGTLPGFLLRKYIRGQGEFLVAGRTLSVFLATATLTATEMGLITVMYFAQLGFLNGFSVFAVGVIALVTTLFVGLTGFLVGGFRESGVTTFAEYYERRYGRGVRLLGGLILATAGILNYGVFLRVEADFVRLLTNVPELTLSSASGWSWQIPSVNLVMSILVVLVLGYTLLGGMVSVVVTDYIQFIVLTAGMAVTTYLVLTEPTTGGTAGIAAAIAEHRPGYGMNPFESVSQGRVVLGLGTVWVLWQCLHWTASSCWQTQAFRTAAADSARTARAMWSFTAVNFFGRAIIPMLWGVAAMAYFARRGMLHEVKDIEAMPRYMAAILPAGVSGLLLAGMLAALMSTHSGYLLAWSGVLTEDLLGSVARWCGRPLGDRVRLWITRFFILCLGAYLLVFGLWYQVKSSVWNFLAVTGTMYFAGAATLLGFGLYWRRANIGGAFAGLVAGAAPGLLYLATHITSLILEPQITDKSYQPVGWIPRLSDYLSEAWVGLISYPLGVLGMVVGSLLYERIRTGRPSTGPAHGPEQAGLATPEAEAAVTPEDIE